MSDILPAALGGPSGTTTCGGLADPARLRALFELAALVDACVDELASESSTTRSPWRSGCRPTDPPRRSTDGSPRYAPHPRPRPDDLSCTQ